jgi:hypothetical protein
MKCTPQFMALAGLCVHVNTMIRWAVFLWGGTMANGYNAPQAADANCVGFPILSVLEIVIASQAPNQY